MSTIFIEMYSIEYACWVNQILGALYGLVCIIRPVTPFIGSDHGTIGQMINDD